MMAPQNSTKKIFHCKPSEKRRGFSEEKEERLSWCARTRELNKASRLYRESIQSHHSKFRKIDSCKQFLCNLFSRVLGYLKSVNLCLLLHLHIVITIFYFIFLSHIKNYIFSAKYCFLHILAEEKMAWKKDEERKIEQSELREKERKFGKNQVHWPLFKKKSALKICTTPVWVLITVTMTKNMWSDF
jgi:hypothetical protein